MKRNQISVQNLKKTYAKGSVEALRDISLEVEGGQIYALLGPNGAGKSTAVKILTTLALPTAGTALVGGYDVVSQAEQVRTLIGVALQEIGIDPVMKPLELLTIQGRLFGLNAVESMQRAHKLIELVQLTDAIDRRVGTYSGGMKRRIDLALALMHDPKILFLDEPTTGLDPASRRDIWKEVRRLNRSLGMTIFLTTQYLEEADELADYISIVDKGIIVAQGTAQSLKSDFGEESINISFATQSESQQAATALQAITTDIQTDKRDLRIYLPQAAAAVPRVVDTLSAATLRPLSLTLKQPTLDDVFLKVTGDSLASQEAQPA